MTILSRISAGFLTPERKEHTENLPVAGWATSQYFTRDQATHTRVSLTLWTPLCNHQIATD